MIDRSLPKGGSAWPRQNIQLDISGLEEQMDDVTYIFYAHLWAQVEFVCLGMKFDRFKEKTGVINISVSTDPSTSCTCHNFLRFTAGSD